MVEPLNMELKANGVIVERSDSDSDRHYFSTSLG